MLQRILFLTQALFFLAFAGCDAFCGDSLCEFTDVEWNLIKTLSPLPDPPLDPTNRFDGDPAAIALGKELFFEKRYSHALKVESALGKVGDKEKVSCVACHDPLSGFSDTRSSPSNLSVGVSWTTRNAPALVNTVYYQSHGWDLRQDTIWNQASTTAETGTNSAGDRCEYARMLWTFYRDKYNAIFVDTPLPDTLDLLHPEALPAACKPKANAEAADGPWEMMSAANKDVINRIMSNQAKAIAAYESRLISRNAPFDLYVAGETAAISAEARKGLMVFIGRGACVDCHSGPFFTDQSAHNLGVPQVGPNVPTTDQGVIAGIPQLLRNTFSSRGAYSDNVELGMARLDGLVEQESDRGKFRTQTLRNLTQSAPFMHNGLFPNLQTVVEFYNQGGGDADFVGEKDVKIRPLLLTPQEISRLVAFLQTLTGEPLPDDLTSSP